MTLLAGRRLSDGVIAEIREAVELAREFNREVVRPHALAVDQRVLEEPDYLPYELVKAANDRGFYTLWLPKAFGGGGFSSLSMLAFSEELASECLGIANLVGSHYVGLTLASSTFSMSVLRRLCLEIAAGEKIGVPCLVSTAITEPEAGTDMEDVELIDRGRVRCRAEKVDGGYRIRGTKIFISNAHLSVWHVVTAYLDGAQPSRNAVILAVRTGTPGFSFGRIERKMGQNASPASVLHFDDCFVPDESVCLAPDLGAGEVDYRDFVAKVSDDVLAMTRPGVAAMAAGAARGVFDKALRHCLDHELDGRPMANQEWAQSRLAEMYKNVKLCQLSAWESGSQVALEGPFRALLSRIAFAVLKRLPGSVAQRVLGPLMAHSSGRKRLLEERARLGLTGADSAYSAQSSFAKFSSSDLAMESCKIALQLMGHEGVRASSGVEKVLRDVKLLQIYEGTNQLNRINLFKRAIAPGYPGVRVFHE